MAMNDLYQALQMFSSGVKDFQTSRAIGQANDYVQQLKASDMNEQQQRAQLQQVSNQLVAHLAMNGTPATTIQAVAGAIGPKQYTNANDMNKDALLTGNKGLASEAEQQQAFEQNPDYKKELIQAKAQAGSNGLQALKFKNEQEEFAGRQFNDFGRYLNENAQSSRSAFGTMGITGNRSGRIEALLGDPSQFSTLNSQDASLIGEGLVNQVKGGAATKEEMASIIPGLSAVPVAGWKTWLSNNPAALHAPGVFEKFQQIASKEKNENDVQTTDEILKRATERQGLASMQGGAHQDDFKRTVAAQLQPYMPGTKAEDIILDPKHGVTTPQMLQLDQKATVAGTYLKKAYAGLNSTDPTMQQEAQKVLQRFGVTPGMKFQDAQKLIQKKIRRGDL